MPDTQSAADPNNSKSRSPPIILLHSFTIGLIVSKQSQTIQLLLTLFPISSNEKYTYVVSIKLLERDRESKFSEQVIFFRKKTVACQI
jgi:hypothetical protein